MNLCPFCSPCLTAASLSVSLTVPSTACLPACLLSGTKEFRSVSVQIPVTRTKTNATEKMQQHQKTLLASLCSDFPHFPTLGSCNYTICLYCCPLRVTMRATYNNHCPIKARMKQEEEGVLFLPLQHLSTKMCVSLICLQMQLSVFCQPDHGPGGFVALKVQPTLSEKTLNACDSLLSNQQPRGCQGKGVEERRRGRVR